MCWKDSVNPLWDMVRAVDSNPGRQLRPMKHVITMKRFTVRFLTLVAVMVFLLVIVGWGAGRFLVVDTPEPSDVLVVLAGDHNDIRFKRGAQLLADGYAHLMLADASSDSVAFGRTPAELEQEFITRTAGPLINRITVCPTRGVSTQEEAKDISHCLDPKVSKVLLVTSDYHTRRALSIVRQELPQYHWSTAAVHDSSAFQPEHWWQQRESAKTTVLEWSKFAWWEAVDRWRNQ